MFRFPGCIQSSVLVVIERLIDVSNTDLTPISDGPMREVLWIFIYSYAYNVIDLRSAHEEGL